MAPCYDGQAPYNGAVKLLGLQAPVAIT